MSLTTEVLIAGAGPVGLALANLLGQYGRKVVLIESRSELIDYPRGVGMDDESFRSLQTMGLIDEVTPYTVPHHIMRLVNGHGEVILTNDPKGEPFGWPRKHGFIQPLVDKVMHDGLARYDNVTVLFEHELAGIQDDGDKVVATVRTGPDEGDTTRIEAEYLVGCEGGRSFTRGWMGVDFEGKSPSTRWVVIDVRNDPLGVPNVFRKGRVLIAGDAAHLMPVWMGQGWNSGMRDATNLGWKLASVLAGQASDHILDTYDVERRDHAKAMINLSMTFGSIIKPTDKRVAFLRDTASRVLNLSPQVKEYFTDMRFKPMPRYGRGVVVEPDSLKPGEAAGRRTSPFVTVHNAVDKRSPVGLQFIQPRVATAEATGVLLDDVIGPWWTVAAWGNDPARLLSPSDLDKLARLGARLVAFTSESQRGWAEKEYAGSGSLVVGDLDGSLKGWFDTRGMGVVFLRPDRFVAAACLAQNAPRALDSLLRAASATVESAPAESAR